MGFVGLGGIPSTGGMSLGVKKGTRKFCGSPHERKDAETGLQVSLASLLFGGCQVESMAASSRKEVVPPPTKGCSSRPFSGNLEGLGDDQNRPAPLSLSKKMQRRISITTSWCIEEVCDPSGRALPLGGGTNQRRRRYLIALLVPSSCADPPRPHGTPRRHKGGE